MRWVQGSNLLELALTSFQDSRIAVLPTHQLAEDEGVEPTGHLRDQGLANLCLSRSAYPPLGTAIISGFEVYYA